MGIKKGAEITAKTWKNQRRNTITAASIATRMNGGSAFADARVRGRRGRIHPAPSIKPMCVGLRA
jgi:hypothetical protein